MLPRPWPLCNPPAWLRGVESPTNLLWCSNDAIGRILPQPHCSCPGRSFPTAPTSPWSAAATPGSQPRAPSPSTAWTSRSWRPRRWAGGRGAAQAFRARARPGAVWRVARVARLRRAADSRRGNRLRILALWSCLARFPAVPLSAPRRVPGAAGARVRPCDDAGPRRKCRRGDRIHVLSWRTARPGGRLVAPGEILRWSTVVPAAGGSLVPRGRPPGLNGRDLSRPSLPSSLAPPRTS